MISLEDECRDGFCVDKKRKKIWEIELNMLDYLKMICKEHRIKWFLIGGSAIGAVRHKGFIPWDDDIDLGMKRDDFERFIKYAPKYLPEQYELQYGLKSDNSEFHYFCRIRDKKSTGIIRQEYATNGVKGVFIEIYPFDNVPSSKVLRTIQWKMSMAYIELIRNRVYHTYMGKMARVLDCCNKNKSTQELYDKWLKLCQKYNSKKSQLVDTVSIPGYSESEVDLFKIEDISSVYQVPFETTTANIAVGNDNCLRKTYGDYMQLPPEEERGMHHQTEIFYDPFKSYIEYENSKEVKDFFGL